VRADGPAISGMARGTMKGSSSVSSAVPFMIALAGKTMPSAMSRRMKPPEICKVEVVRPRNCKRSLPQNRKINSTARAMRDSRMRIRFWSRFGYLEMMLENNGKFPKGSRTTMRMVVMLKKSMMGRDVVMIYF